MGLRIVYGKAGVGKSNFIFEEISNKIKNNEKNKIYIITPEQFSFTAEKKLMQNKKSVINAEVITFNRMAYRVQNEIGGIINNNLTKCGKAMLIYSILQNEKSEFNLLNKSDENMVFQLFDFIRKEEDNRQMGTNYLQQQWLNSILVLVARNIVHEAKDECLSVKYLTINETNPAVYMLQYIQQHIHQPELLRAESLSKIFHLSPDYIGIYFKRYYQETLQQYIGRNRLKMVENLLLNSSMTVKEIAYKMGYTDSCYLVKSFQKVYGISSLKYRQEHPQSNNLK